MPQRIDYVGKTPEQLLVELCLQGNSLVSQSAEILNHVRETNGKVKKNDERISMIEAEDRAEKLPIWCNWRHMVILVVIVASISAGSEWAMALIRLGT